MTLFVVIVRRLCTKILLTKNVFIHTVDSGTKEGCLTLSCFMLGDQASAVGARFSPEEIAGTEAYFLPLVID